MMQESESSSPETERSRPSVGLRSDAATGSGSGAAAGASGLKKNLGIIVGGVVLLAVLGGVVYAAMSWRDRPQTADYGEDSFGLLPSSDEAGQGGDSRVSGLSGRTCDHPTRRAIAVMMPSDPVVRPVSGFSKADMVWELPVLASNVTRLMSVYQCDEPTEIGSVRSARHDYLFLAAGVDAILAHWGGSYHALNRVDAGEFQTINALSNPHGAFFRKNTLPAPHNGFTSYENLWNALQKLGYRTESEFEGYEFKDDIAADERPAGGTLAVAWPGQFRVSYEYNPETNRYERYWAGVKQVDAEDGQVVAPSSVVIMRAPNGLAEGPGGYNDVGIEGTGALEVYQDGMVIKGTWRKDERYKEDPVHFMNEQGDPIRFTRGQIWVMTPSAEIPVTWEVQANTPTTAS